jgi:protein-L-isoaspartate O-methyltransferase
VVSAEAGGVRQYINSLRDALVGVAAADGKFLWRYDKLSNGTANSGALIVRGDRVFYANSYGVGCGVLRLAREGDGFKVEELWREKIRSSPWLGSPVLVGDHVYFLQLSGEPVCLEFDTGKIRAQGGPQLGRSSLTYADGHLYLRRETGQAFLVAGAPERFEITGSFTPPRPSPQEYAGVFPVIAGGRLLLRDMDVLLCYDIKEPKRPPSRGPRPVFVPSPQDVVEKMLEMAQVKKGDVVYDLGCGDGRIVVTAAKKYGVKAVGVDLDRACVEMARENVKANQVEHLVRIERRDLFEVDLSDATVVTLYLLPAVNVKLIPQLEKLKAGARVASHAFDMQGVQPTQVLKFVSKEEEVERPLYLWTTPLQKQRKD